MRNGLTCKTSFGRQVESLLRDSFDKVGDREEEVFDSLRRGLQKLKKRGTIDGYLITSENQVTRVKAWHRGKTVDGVVASGVKVT